MIIGLLEPGDRRRWAELWRQYLEFYQTSLPEEVYDHCWSRLMAGQELHGLAARDGASILGITHYLFHPSAWTLKPVVYLQDLFTDPAQRGRGVARALIEAVAARGVTAGSPRLYWLTQSDNETARALYDKVAQHTGFIRYEVALPVS